MIVSHITPKDALKLSLVARRVHLVDQRQALSYVIMSSMQSVSRICTYMLADISGRLKWVRGLCMYAALPYKGSNPGANYPQMVDKAAAAMRLFVSLYQHTTALRYLYFAVIEKLLSFQPLLLDVLSAFINIVEIQLVRCGGSETPKLLNGMRSRPRHLVLNIDPVRPLPLETGASMSSIARLRDLRTMEIVGLKDQNANRPALLMRNLRHSLPNVIDLTLSACQMENPAVLRAFPNVQALRFTEWNGVPRSTGPRQPATSGLAYVEGHVQCLSTPGQSINLLYKNTCIWLPSYNHFHSL